MNVLLTYPYFSQVLASRATLAIPAVEPPHVNAQQPQMVDPLVRQTIETLSPLDMWLYAYASHLFKGSPTVEPTCPGLGSHDAKVAILRRRIARRLKLAFQHDRDTA